jgi:hypothetical protein
VHANELERTLDYLDKSGTRYVSDGDPKTVARPVASAAPTTPTPAKRAATQR